MKKSSSKRETAIALRYDQQTDSAPRVIAKGKGEIARKIKAIATLQGIPVMQDDTLVEMLSQIDIDREIPVELYSAVAEVLSLIYKADNHFRKDS